MKKLFFILASVFAFVGCSSNKCEIVGRIDNFNAIGMSIWLICGMHEQLSTR